MIIEFIGTPGSGKTTLLPTVIECLRDYGVQGFSVIEAARPCARRTWLGKVAGRFAPANWPLNFSNTSTTGQQVLRDTKTWTHTYAANGLGASKTFSATMSGAVLVFLVFVVAAAEIGIAIPIVLLLSRQRHTLDVGAYSGLKG